jgi:hypothetical protein
MAADRRQVLLGRQKHRPELRAGQAILGNGTVGSKRPGEFVCQFFLHLFVSSKFWSNRADDTKAQPVEGAEAACDKIN